MQFLTGGYTARKNSSNSRKKRIRINRFVINPQSATGQGICKWQAMHSVPELPIIRIRNAISIGGDSDTIAAMTGSIAEAAYGIPDWIKEKAWSYLDEPLKDVLRRWKAFVSPALT